VGRLFQDRYKSETIEDEPYLLSVIRYVHNNPEKAGITKKEKYKWSMQFLEKFNQKKLTG